MAEFAGWDEPTRERITMLIEARDELRAELSAERDVVRRRELWREIQLVKSQLFPYLYGKPLSEVPQHRVTPGSLMAALDDATEEGLA